MKVAVFGGFGFVGRHVVAALVADGHLAQIVRSPRMEFSAVETLATQMSHNAPLVERLAERLHDVDAVVNASGVANPVGRDAASLMGGNALWPAVLAKAATKARVRRLVHVSSAAVQGRGCLDESMRHQPLSPYAASKSAGELAVLEYGASATILRPTSVHGADRSMTRRVVQAARSPWAFVAGDGSRPTPQVLVQNVGRACSYLTSAEAPPEVVLQPWEGLSTQEFLTILGMGKSPKHVPEALLVAAMTGAYRLPHARPHARRLEMLAFGQEQDEGWLVRSGFNMPDPVSAWSALALKCRENGKDSNE